MKRFFTAIALMALLAGCAATTTTVKTEGVKPDKEKISELKPGVTTREEAVELFGEPTEVKQEDSEEKLIYVFEEKEVPTYFDVIEMEARAKVKSTSLELVVKDGVVSSYRFRSEEE